MFVLGLYYEHKEKKRKEHEEWIYTCRRRLHKMALQYRDDCIVATKEVVAQYIAFLNWKRFIRALGYTGHAFLSDYIKKIEQLKEEYLESYAIKYADGDNCLRCEAEDLPSYILDEYREEVSEIAKTFHDFEYLMWNQIRELEEKADKMEGVE